MPAPLFFRRQGKHKFLRAFPMEFRSVSLELSSRSQALSFLLVPKLFLGTHLSPKRSFPSKRNPVNRHDAVIIQKITPRRGIPPVLRTVYISPFYRVLMDVLYLLPRHFVIGQQLRMVSFLPDLMPALRLVFLFVVSELGQ
jgi:hypothetical protein